MTEDQKTAQETTAALHQTLSPEKVSLDKKTKESPNTMCNSCLKWMHFEENCRVFWEGKKFCTMRVATQEDWESEQQLLKR